MATINGIFDAVRYSLPKTSDFSANHDVKTACKIGEVIPFDCIPTYGGDRWNNISYSKQAKFNPLVAPSFQRMVLKSWSFYVRNSDVWDDFDEFYTGVDVKNGRTAYNSSKSPLVHPFLKANKITQCGTGYLGARLNMTGIDIDRVNIQGEKVYIPADIIQNCLEQLSSAGDAAVSYHYDDRHVKSLFGPYIGWSEFLQMGFAKANIVLDEDKSYIEFVDSGDDPSNVDPVRLNPEHVYNGMNFRGMRPIFSPGSVCDYLGFSVTDWRTYVNTDDFKNQIKNLPYGSRAYEFAKKYILKESYTLPLMGFDNPFIFVDGDNFLTDMRLYGAVPSVNINNDAYDFVGPITGGSHYSGTWNLYPLTELNNTDSGSVTLGEVICRYIVWCKLHGVSTTMLSDAPFFDICPIQEFVETSNFEIDSLRLRAYHKLWNDYYREPSLTAEIPIPFSDGGDDFNNYRAAIGNYIIANSDSEGLYDWRRENLFTSDRYRIFPYLATKYYNSTYLYNSNNIDAYNLITGLLGECLLNDLLCEPFRHVRVRDYLTGALPNTGIVDVVAPIMGQDLQGMYDNLPYTNNPVSYSDRDGLKVDNTEINPTPATYNGRTGPIGWLDIENLHITQKLKEYFLTLRHAMNGIKDYMKVFFNVDIDNQTIRRARFLRGDEQYINISEVISSAETTSQPLGALAGRATSFGTDGGISFDVKECGFFITLCSLSPITMNVGGIDRQMIRHSRFDYFNPKFAELGDMSITKKEVSIMPMLLGSDTSFYDKTFGYTQRYMDCKFIRSQIHADFLGAMSDWHLDHIQPSLAVDDSISLSQNWLEEREDDRIFAEVNDNANTCFIWAECTGSFTRALPAIEREVIA